MGEEAVKPVVKWDQKSLAALKAGPAAQNYPDPTTPGLWLRITKAAKPGARVTKAKHKGGARTWLFYYRMGGRATKLQCLKVGTFEALPLVRAREQARAYRTQVDNGIDPATALKEAGNRGQTVAQTAEKFMDEYAPKNLSEKSRIDYRDSIDNHITPKLGPVPIRDLSRDQVSSWHTGIPDKKGRGEIAANRALAVLSSICTQAEIWKLRTEGANPCRHVDRFEEEPRVRDIQPEELEAIGKALRALEGRCNVWALTAVKVAALCFGRVAEVLALRRDREVYLKAGYALIKKHKTRKKTGAKHLELPAAAVKLLEELPEQKGNPFYFPGRKEGAPMSKSGLRWVWLRVLEEAGLPPKSLHIHDFRSFGASEGQDAEIADKVVSAVLGHSDTRTTQKHYAKVRKASSAAAAATMAAPVAQAFGLQAKPGPSARKLIKRAVQRLKT